MPRGTRRHQWRTLLVVAATAALTSAGVTGVRPAPAAAEEATLAATAGCGKAPTLASGTRTIQTSGRSRSYILRVPDNYDSNRPYRLIFGFHWNGGTANDVDSGGTSGYPWSYYGLRALSNDSAIFVAPQGLNNGWANSGGQDVVFVDDMIREIDAGLCVDTTQRFAGGFSYGGGMSYALACARPTVFRAVAVYAGGQLSGCSGGTEPIAYIGLHGLRDPVLNISQGRSLRDRFVRNNGCTPQNPPEPAQGSLTHTVTTYSGCRAGYPVVWAAYDAGHTPGPVDGSAGDFEPGERSWTRPVVWNFFAQFQTSDPGPDPGPDPVPTTFRLRSESAGRCLDVNGASSANGAQMILWDCHGNANQQFSQSGQELRVLGKCLDVPGNAAGTRVQISDCGGANQKWNLNSNGTVSNAQNGLCLDVNGAATANGTAVVAWTCHTGANQRWARA
ncbi:ricin-type beta-trefoil lectin domain protein [Jidongwangia harbinensis]|uniref:ricin-type beta-trefoil lectin domain protein n=1 Tax=Jidongwangia harbinensis TaxID=2878561 RepID=UPI001CDA0E82|nr:ricin-type beta-trefoil lectin domain protein [Jidongwangia harbinensis]MCA2215476.1 ricin-type beta-trefoil lectin domain protein [Jidongwangia harbinensis]